MGATIGVVVTKFVEEYTSKTPKKLKIIDAYLTYIFFTGVFQFLYCCLVGTFPFNAFLSGFISSVASFILGVCLRLQVNPANKSQFASISPERGFADFLFAHVILHLIVSTSLAEYLRQPMMSTTMMSKSSFAPVLTSHCVMRSKNSQNLF